MAEVPPGFLDCVSRAQQLDVIKPPEPGQSREFHIDSGIKDVRAEEDPIQGEASRKRPALSALWRPRMLNPARIEADAFHLGPCPAIVLGSDTKESASHDVPI